METLSSRVNDLCDRSDRADADPLEKPYISRPRGADRFLYNFLTPVTEQSSLGKMSRNTVLTLVMKWRSGSVVFFIRH